jgi:WhiB family redox-sensing transcriptional regulator
VTAVPSLDYPVFSAPALCAEVGGDLWHPERGGSAREAKAVCALCEARPECLAYALEHRLADAWDGVWGGTAPRERRAMLRAQEEAQRETAKLHPVAAAAPEPEPEPEPPRRVRPWRADELREAVAACRMVGMGPVEIAAALGVSVAAVRRSRQGAAA